MSKMSKTRPPERLFWPVPFPTQLRIIGVHRLEGGVRWEIRTGRRLIGSYRTFQGATAAFVAFTNTRLGEQ